MKIPWTLHLVVLAILLLTARAGNTTNLDFSILGGALDETELQKRVKKLDMVVQPRFTPTVKQEIRSYVLNGQHSSRRMLGRSVLYFPIFEFYLEQYNLPTQLKVLPMVESGLRPDAESKSGAVGLWQFMYLTAREQGLLINYQIDERRDPYRSTEAAVQYLSGLYQRFGTWELALAAYNCGPGTVNRAIRQGGSKDFWKIRHLLPEETQKYIPRFIAASYIAEYHYLHNLQPEELDYSMQFTQTVRVFNRVSFKELSGITHVPVSVLRELNPAHLGTYITANKKGNYLILPQLGMEALKDYLRWTENPVIETDLPKQIIAATQLIHKGTLVISVDQEWTQLKKLAADFNCSSQQIMSWNNLTYPQVYFRQELVLFPSENGQLAALSNKK